MVSASASARVAQLSATSHQEGRPPRPPLSTPVSAIPQDLLGAVLGMLELRSILLVVTLLIPLSILFSAVELALSMMAKSFKEAQSYINPLMILVIVPAFIGLMPGMELNWVIALIPILNIS